MTADVTLGERNVVIRNKRIMLNERMKGDRMEAIDEWQEKQGLSSCVFCWSSKRGETLGYTLQEGRRLITLHAKDRVSLVGGRKCPSLQLVIHDLFLVSSLCRSIAAILCTTATAR